MHIFIKDLYPLHFFLANNMHVNIFFELLSGHDCFTRQTWITYCGKVTLIFFFFFGSRLIQIFALRTHEPTLMVVRNWHQQHQQHWFSAPCIGWQMRCRLNCTNCVTNILKYFRKWLCFYHWSVSHPHILYPRTHTTLRTSHLLLTSHMLCVLFFMSIKYKAKP